MLFDIIWFGISHEEDAFGAALDSFLFLKEKYEKFEAIFYLKNFSNSLTSRTPVPWYAMKISNFLRNTQNDWLKEPDLKEKFELIWDKIKELEFPIVLDMYTIPLR